METKKHISKHPKSPSIKTIFNGFMLYLLNIHFSIINAPVLKNNEINKNTIPTICSPN
jgi:hypothetical protein